MKQPEYIEGPEALDRFKSLATAILQAPRKKKKQAKKPASQEKPQKSDKGLERFWRLLRLPPSLSARDVASRSCL